MIEEKPKPPPSDEVITEKTEEQNNLNIQPQSSCDMYPNFYGSHLGHSEAAPEEGCKACEFHRLQMQAAY